MKSPINFSLLPVKLRDSTPLLPLLLVTAVGWPRFLRNLLGKPSAETMDQQRLSNSLGAWFASAKNLENFKTISESSFIQALTHNPLGLARRPTGRLIFFAPQLAARAIGQSTI